jgi:transcription initiation factor TFIIIB Brf1 subunit/transcription initiation factor TFIIB
MCERICPACGSREHGEQYGICGLTLYCDGCGAVLAHRADPEWAPLDRDPNEWAKEQSGVTPGAEANDPRDDEMYRAR